MIHALFTRIIHGENSHEVFSNVNIQILFNHSKLWFQSHLLQTTFIVVTSTKTVFQYKHKEQRVVYHNFKV